MQTRKILVASKLDTCLILILSLCYEIKERLDLNIKISFTKIDKSYLRRAIEILNETRDLKWI